MALVDESDEELMARVRKGEREPVSILVRRFADPLLTFIVRLVGDRSQGEEIFQEVFLAVWEKRKRYQPLRSFKSWLFGIAANKSKAWLRQSRNQRAVDTDSRWTCTETDPTDNLVQDETSALVVHAVSLLPIKQREVVMLRLWHDMSYSEIAIALSRSESTIRTNMAFGLESLRKYLEPRMRD
jgi:RNA polymerase sigma-70 factor (ECF subfamily)